MGHGMDDTLAGRGVGGWAAKGWTTQSWAAAFGGDAAMQCNWQCCWRVVGTLDDGCVHKVPLSRAQWIQSPGHMICAAVTEWVMSDNCYLQVPRLVGKSARNSAEFRDYSDSGPFELRYFHRNFFFQLYNVFPPVGNTFLPVWNPLPPMILPIS